MGNVSQLEHEQDRRDDAVHLGLLPESNVPRGIKVRTGLETTQGQNQKQTEPSEARRRELTRRALEKKSFRNRASNEEWLPAFLAIYSSAGRQVVEKAPAPPRCVVVVVERKVVVTLMSRKPQAWLDIYKRNEKRNSSRPPSFADRNVLESKYPLFFLPCADGPSSIDCLAEWVNGEWNLLEVFDPYA